LHGLIQAFYERSMEEANFVIPYDRQARVALLHERCRVLEERYEENGAHLRVRAPESVLGGLRREFQAESEATPDADKVSGKRG
jgi:50S ribosomal subunit-associated GTPase HflX